jgi:hypothetical protein
MVYEKERHAKNKLGFEISYLLHNKIRWDERSVTYEASKVKGRSWHINVRKVMDVLSSTTSALAG